MVQVIPQTDLGETLGHALGQGFSEGVNQLTSYKLNEMLAERKDRQRQKEQEAKQQAAANKPFSVFDVVGALGKLGLSKDQLGVLEPEDIQEIVEIANKNISEMGRDQAFISAMQEKFNPKTHGSDLPAGLQALQNTEMKEEESLWDVMKKGLESSISGRLGAIGRGEGAEEFQKRTELQDPGFLKNLLFSLSKFGGDFPYYGAGGAAGAAAGGAAGSLAGPFGAAAGGTIGAGAGALALPAMIETGLKEYQKYIDRGGKGTFGDFINSASETLEAGTKGAAEGALLGPLARLKVLDKIPGAKNLLKLKGGKAVEKVLNTGAQAGIFTTAVGASEGRIPSKEEYGQNLGLFLGLDLFHNAGKYSSNIYKQLKDAQIPPKEAATRIQEVVEEKGYDLNKPKDVVRVVRDVTAEKTKAGEIAKETFKETEGPRQTPSEIAESLSERPLEEYLKKEAESKRRKERPLTEKETAKREAAGKEVEEIDRKISKISEDVDFLRDRLDKKLPKEQKQLAEIALNQKEKELKELRRRREDQEGIAKKGQKPFREADLLEPIDKHIEELSRAAASPESATSKDLLRMFDRDQKYIDRMFDLAEKGKIPEVKFKDRYIKTLEAYQRGYAEAASRANQSFEDMKPYADSVIGPQMAKEKAVLDRYRELLRRNTDINKAKIEAHKDKVNSLAQLKKPLVKQTLKKLRGDLKDLQKDFVKQIKLEKAIEGKFDQVLKDSILKDKPKDTNFRLKNAEAVAEKLTDKKLDAGVKEASREFKVPEGRIKKLMEKLGPEVRDIIKDFKEDPSKGINRARKLYRHMPFTAQLAVGSLLSAAMAEAGIPYYVRFWFIPSNSIIRGVATGVGTLLRKTKKNFLLDGYAREIANRRKQSLDSAMKYINSLDEKLSPKDRKEVLKRYKEGTRQF